MAQDPLSLEFEWRSKRFKDAHKGLKALSSHLNRQWQDVPGLIGEELKKFLEDVAEALELRHSGAWPEGTGPKTLSKRSGFMIESIKESVTVTGSTMTTLEGHISVPYTRKIHEHGGVIRPKRAKYLTIPLPAALDSNGVPLKKSAREWENTFVLRSRKGNLLIVQKKGTQIVPLYVLKTEVYIPPRLGLGDTLRAGTTMLADRISDRVLKHLLETA